MEFSQTIAQLATALAQAQGEMKPAHKDSNNPHFRSKYADLASVWEACRDPLSKNGLAVTQTVACDGNLVHVATALMHKSGEWIKDTLTVPAAQATAQAVGSAITYARRYALSAIVGVAPDEDDDGNAASNRQVVDSYYHKPPKVEATPATKSGVPAPAPTPPAKPDMKAEYQALRDRLVALFGELRTRVLVKEATAAAGEDRAAILTKMRETIAEEERRHPPSELEAKG